MTQPLLNLPDSACIASVIMTLTRVVGVTKSPFTRESQSFKWPGEYWSADFRLPPITKRETASDWMAFGGKLEGMYGRFLMGDPAARTPRGIATGTPLVDGSSQSGNTLNTKGWTPNVTGILLKGDYFQVGTGSSSRLHMLTEDADSDGSGDAVLTLAPALRSSPADDSSVVVNEPKGVFMMIDNAFSWSVEPGPIYRFSFQAVEDVNA